MIAKIWSRDMRHTIKSCAGVILIGAMAAGAMLIIRLVGERRLQRFLGIFFYLRRRPKADKLTNKAVVPDSQT